MQSAKHGFRFGGIFAIPPVPFRVLDKFPPAIWECQPEISAAAAFYDNFHGFPLVEIQRASDKSRDDQRERDAGEDDGKGHG